MQRLHADQGGEFASNELRDFCEQCGVIQQFTNAYAFQESGIEERANGVVLPRIRAMLTSTRLPNLLWGEALLHVLHTLNVLPTTSLGFVSPHSKLYGEVPYISVLRTWGCLAWVRIPPESRQRKTELTCKTEFTVGLQRLN